MVKADDDKHRMIKSINPATLEVNAEVKATPREDVAPIVAAAREAQKSWGKLKFQKRLDCLMRAKEHILSNLDDVARTITLDNGKPLVEALNSEVYPVLDMFRFCAKDARRALREERVNNPVFPLARLESSNVFEPVGVVGIISPWNFPFAIPMTQILMALTAGNTVVFKPAELTAWTGNLIRRIFEAAKLPEGALGVVQGSGAELGGEMVDAGLNRIVFTGSVPVGMSLMERAAKMLTPITLELGGKDPFIVLDDADINRASSAAVWGAFINAGQVCASVERVYVDKKIAAKFTVEVVRKTKKLRVGNGLRSDVDVGPLISEARISAVEAHIKDAVGKGAKVLAGGGRLKARPGWFFEPTVLADVNHGMDCMTEETFGPTLPIMTFSDAEEAVALANDSKYGLTASVWSRDAAKANELARRIETGTVVVNNCLLTYGFAQCPWGGVKHSGIGRTHSVHGLYEFTNIKNVTVNRALLKEDLWWYPYSEGKLEGMKGMLNALFRGGMLCRGSSLVKIIKSFGR